MTYEEAVEHYKQNNTFYFDNTGYKELYDLVVRQEKEIKRLTIREYRLTEYMHDIKNYVLTMREIANNAIDEGEIRE